MPCGGGRGGEHTVLYCACWSLLTTQLTHSCPCWKLTWVNLDTVATENDIMAYSTRRYDSFLSLCPVIVTYSIVSYRVVLKKKTHDIIADWLASLLPILRHYGNENENENEAG